MFHFEAAKVVNSTPSFYEGGCHMRMPRVSAKIVILILILSACPCLSQEKVKFPIGASSKTLGYGPLWVAWKQGFFDQQGLANGTHSISLSPLGQRNALSSGNTVVLDAFVTQ